MSIYDLTYSKLGQQLLPPDKRNLKLVAFAACLLAPMQWLRDLWFGTYRTGAIYPTWDEDITYHKYDRVSYHNSIYESTVPYNLAAAPTIENNWMLVQTNLIGLGERLLYSGQTLTLTWAMNKWFGTTFRQPNRQVITQVARASNVATVTITNHGYGNQIVFIENLTNTSFNGIYKITVVDANTFTYANAGSNLSAAADTGQAYAVSDIYTNNNYVSTPVFIVGQSESNSSDVFTTISSEFVVNGYSFANQINFTIYVPVGVYDALDTAMVNNDSIFRSFVDQYLPAGIIYKIQTY